jgi:two-component sensor histidine kinase
MWKPYIHAFLLFGTLPANHADGQNVAPTGNLNRLIHQLRSTSADTAHISALLQLSDWYLTRAGDDRNTLDSAAILATQAATLSHDRAYPKGHEEARFLLAKTAFKEKDWPRLRRLADACNDSTRVRIALVAMHGHDLVKDFPPSSTDSALSFLRHVLITPAPTRKPLRQTLLLLRLAIYYRSRSDSVTSTAPTLNIVDFTRLSGPNNWNESLRRWLSFYLRTDPVATAALAATPNLDTRDAAGIITIQRTAALAIAYEADTHWYDGKLALAGKEYSLAIDINRRCSYPESWPYFNIIEFYLSNGNASKALFYGLEAVTRLQKTGNPGLQFEAWWCLGQINYELGKPAVARGYYDTVLSIMGKRNQNPDAWLFKSVTQCYLRENDPAGAVSWLHDHVVRGDMGEFLYRQLVEECFGDCYFALGEYARAEPLYLDCYTIGGRIGRYNQALAAYPLGNLYLQQKKYEKARAYLQPLVTPANYYVVPLSMQRDVHGLLYVTDSATGDYPSAMRHLRTRQYLTDSLFNIARNGQIQELTIQYESGQKDRDLRLQQEHIQLLKNEAQLQQATLQQVRTFRNTLIASSAMLIALLAVLYSRYRTKQKTNRILRLQQNAINHSNCELQRMNVRQQRLLAEKEWLMNEVHHRVKTNLQIVTSLLNMQVGYMNDEFTLHAFGEIGSRIRTISLIHQRLYREDGNLTTINMRDYIHELSAYLLDNYDKPGIVIDQQIDPIELNITQCVPVGLILNEAITNALHFAFPAANSSATNTNEEGIIHIRMHQNADGLITLSIADNGIGLPPDFDPIRDANMGLQLIQTLGLQLEGETLLENLRPSSTEGWLAGDYHGLSITVTFQRQESDLTTI